VDDSLMQVIGRLRRAQPRNADTMAVCDALEKMLQTAAGKAKFDKTTYQREYMRKWRAKQA
jgi:hypothetical protein